MALLAACAAPAELAPAAAGVPAQPRPAAAQSAGAEAPEATTAAAGAADGGATASPDSQRGPAGNAPVARAPEAPPPGAEPTASPAESPTAAGGLADLGQLRPFTNIARQALGDNAFVNNWHPGVAIFDYDRDGDMDFYVTVADGTSAMPEAPGGPNLLFRNEGAGVFSEQAQAAGVDAFAHNSTAAVACDLDNDGFQDLYVAGYGRIGDFLDYRSVDAEDGLRQAVSDRLYRNRGDGTFAEVAGSAFGTAVNVRSGMTVACADVDGDGWLDLFVGNRADQDFIRFDDPRHHGHYNVLYRNNRDLTFTDITEAAGLLGPQVRMFDPTGAPLQWEDPYTGAVTRGYDPTLLDRRGNRVGDPTGQTLASMFFDHDDDGDPDLWLADDGDALKVYRNDSTAEAVRFVSIGEHMGIDKVGSWMGFAVGDYDGDQDLDVFVTNIGFHFLLAEAPRGPSGDCAYSHQFGWGTCYHYLLRNDGTRDQPGVGSVTRFANVAADTPVEPSRAMPPASLDAQQVLPHWRGEAPRGLSAYDFGFGTTFFDYENDGDQDLYWLGSMGGRGEGPNGQMYQGAGRMLRGDGRGAFQDITVEARLLDIQGVDYSVVDPADPDFDAQKQRIDPRFHENGKGLASCDLDGDGYVDLIGTNSNGPVFLAASVVDFFRGPLFLWRNGGGDGHWLGLRLRGRMALDGTGSNADAVGARITVTAAVDGAGPRSQVRQVLATSNFLGMSCVDLHFGLGVAATVERIDITWPSGRQQRLTGVAVDQVLAVDEPAPD